MKRFFLITLCFVLLLSLFGCSATQEPTPSAMGNGGIPSQPNDDVTDDTSSEKPDDAQDPVPETENEKTPPTQNEAPSDSDKEEPEKSEPDRKPEPDASAPDTSKPDTSEPPAKKPESNTAPQQPTGCSHANTTLSNAAAASCTQAGYTGDTVCKDCKQILSKGSQLQATGHKNTEIRNKKDATTSSAGYTGDTYCKDCSTKISGGTTIPKLEGDTQGKYPFELPDGTVIYVNDEIDIRKYTMKAATKSASHQYSSVEQEILKLVNAERKKAGLSSLSWYEDAYYFTKIRAQECFSKFDHTRPNGKSWTTVYTDKGVLLYGRCGENLHLAQGYSIEEIAAQTVQDWMDSPGHKANILNANYKQIAIAVVQEGNKISTVQNFFG